MFRRICARPIRLIHDGLSSTVSLIPDLARHLIDSGGKRLRPLLTLAAARMGGYQGHLHINLAAAVEFIHTATLLHDDVVDESALRRGKVSANIVWGNKPSVLVGDFLFSRAFELMVETGEMAVLGILAHASSIIAEGEVMQLKSANNLATTEEHYLSVVRAKTAALFSAAAESGALLANRSDDYVSALRVYGDNLGIAFQLVDDALDYSGRQALMGKSVGDDFREGKATLPVILAYARADELARRFWQRTIETGPQSESDLDARHHAGGGNRRDIRNHGPGSRLCRRRLQSAGSGGAMRNAQRSRRHRRFLRRTGLLSGKRPAALRYSGALPSSSAAYGARFG